MNASARALSPTGGDVLLAHQPGKHPDGAFFPGLFRGATLLEVMISVLILGLALVPVFDLIRSGAQRSRDTQEELTATNLAAELVEQVACMPFSGVPVMNERPLENTDSGVTLGDNPGTILILSDAPKGFQRNLTIESLSPCLKRVSARIDWGTAPRRQVALTTLMEWRP